MIEKETILLILTPGFPANESDSTCLPAHQQLIKAINQVNPDCKLVVVSFQYPFHQKPYDWFGNQVIPLGGKNKKKTGRIITWLRAWRSMNKIRKQFRIKGILCFWYGECALLGKRFSRKYQIPLYIWLLGQDAKAGNKYCKFCQPEARELLSISDYLSNLFFTNYGIRPAHSFPNALLPGLLPQTCITRDIDILGVGSLIPLKQYHLLIETVGQLTKVNPGIRAILCGEGILKNTLIAQIKASGLEKNIQLLGECTHAETLILMQRSKILLHPSSFEGFSGACLEALYAGAHVISFCKPMDIPIRNWHIVSTQTEMTERSLSVLSDPETGYRSVIPYNMSDNARKLLSLFAGK